MRSTYVPLRRFFRRLLHAASAGDPAGDFEALRPVSHYPKYPPYVENDHGYIETYFYNFYLNNRADFEAKGRTLLPIWWTTLAGDNVQLPVQRHLDLLPRKGKWFTVSQLDSGIRYDLPANTKHFAAGGLGGGIPIPLICSPLPSHCLEVGENEKNHLNRKPNYLCSFVGSNTHPLRQRLYDCDKSKPASTLTYFSENRKWSQTVTPDQLVDFAQITKTSEFALAPRGYGLSSFRLYEIMQLGAIPVYVSDIHWLPWQDELNWEDFCVIIKPEQIPRLYHLLADIPEEKRAQMRARIREIYPRYFSLEGTCRQILKRI